ncbi:MAG: SprT-like domain-containing protein [Bacteroidales bacterium]|nr:SprT-like domain-containing protein [Bacteroidales bacterium]
METNNNRNLMKATPQWMAQKYDEMNSWLFNGALGDCKFEIFTTGKGSQGRTLGWFCIDSGGNELKVERYSRKMYIPGYYNSNKTYINKENFVKFCQPTIKLNGNYSGTEQALLSTLVHEMCHYYTYMNGWCPTQAHGTEFRNIAAVVSSRSNGLFTVQRLATAEEMTEYELDPKIQQKNLKRLENKKSKITLVVVYLKSGEIRLINAANQNVVDEIKSHHEKRHDANYILTSNDPQLLDLVFNTGFKSSMRTYRYWTINDKPELLRILNNKDNFDIDETPYL